MGEDEVSDDLTGLLCGSAVKHIRQCVWSTHPEQLHFQMYILKIHEDIHSIMYTKQVVKTCQSPEHYRND